ncbi:hypothetical protein SS50377_25258 [Spironucleus salmonicida]|uniref:Uncharacterized protein n=1 Tax=Spironucleus salmonicida TaxID=348837 RepID=V6LDU6_9EUKA|nr:hypothetical protein SS50377_25258 [Spironucleus salmonicida]|eukprot:EST41861.1 Hypothetical protein SS50377_18697 [Spironucleus salmonicida]
MSLECPFPHLIISPELIIQENEGRVDEWENSAIYYSFNTDLDQFIPKQFSYTTTEADFQKLPKQILDSIQSLAAGRVQVSLKTLPNLRQLYLYESTLLYFTDILFLQNLETLSFSSISNLPDLRPLQLLRSLKFVAFDNLIDTRFLPIFSSKVLISYNINVKNLVFQQRMTKLAKGYKISDFIKEDLKDDWLEIKRLKKPSTDHKIDSQVLLTKFTKQLLYQVSGVHFNFFEKQLEVVNAAHFEEQILFDDEIIPNLTIPFFFKYKFHSITFQNTILTQNIISLNLSNLKLQNFDFSLLKNLQNLLISRCEFQNLNSIVGCKELKSAQFSYCINLVDLQVLYVLQNLTFVVCRGCEKLQFIPNFKFLLVVGSPLINIVGTMGNGKLSFAVELKILREIEQFQQQNLRNYLQHKYNDNQKCLRILEMKEFIQENLWKIIRAGDEEKLLTRKYEQVDLQGLVAKSDI